MAPVTLTFSDTDPVTDSSVYTLNGDSEAELQVTIGKQRHLICVCIPLHTARLGNKTP